MFRSQPHPLHRPIQHRRHGNAGAGRQRIDDEILQSRVPSRHPELQEFEHADHNDRNRCREQPMPRIGEAEGQPDQDEGERMLAVLAEIGVRPKPRRPSVAKVTAAAKSQAKIRRMSVIASG